MRILPRALRSLFSKPFTRRFPKVKPPLPETFRGKHLYSKEKCIGCQICVKNCPTNAITFIPKTKKVEFNLMRCIFCGLCEDVCPVKAIEFGNEIVFSQDKNKLVVK